MISNYFKTALRSLRSNKIFSLINIVGLAIGLAVFILIMLWVKNEMSYNDFHADKTRIAEVMLNRSINADISTFPACPTMLAPTMQKRSSGSAIRGKIFMGRREIV